MVMEMEEIALKESDISKLKRYPLKDIWCTESIIYYFKKDLESSSTLIKKLFLTDEKRVSRKIETIDRMKDSELSTYKELIIPEEVIVVGGIKTGFTIPEVQDSINLHCFLNDIHISNKEKIEVLKKIGELVKRVQCQKQEFYFGDLQEYNFLVGKNNDISVIDLDSSSVTRKKPLETKYIIIDKKTHDIAKYKVNKTTRSYPCINTENYCYNTMVLNFLAGEMIHKLTYEEHFDYVNYLFNIGIIPKEMKKILINHYSDKNNELVLDYLDCIQNEIARGSYSVYKNLKKIKK